MEMMKTLAFALGKFEKAEMVSAVARAKSVKVLSFLIERFVKGFPS
jgi:hypothetical protein